MQAKLQITIDDIQKGPDFIWTELAVCANKANFYEMSAKAKILALIDLVTNENIIRGKHHSLLRSFILAVLNQQAAIESPDNLRKSDYLSNSLTQYQQLTSSAKFLGEITFYSFLQIGFIRMHLGDPWHQSEDAFVSAHEITPERGESLAAIIKHYLSANELSIAYIFSSFAKKKFFDRPVPADWKWGVDPAFYKWKVLDLHTAVCYSMGALQEAKTNFHLILKKTQQHPQQFHPDEIMNIQNKCSLLNVSV